MVFLLEQLYLIKAQKMEYLPQMKFFNKMNLTGFKDN